MKVDQSSTISVYTFLPFSSETCGNTKPFLINEFKDGKFTENVETLFTDKTSNLNGCEVRIATSDDSQPYVFSELLPNGSYHFYGRDVDLVNTLSEQLNFRINFTYVGEEGSLSEKGIAEGPFLMLFEDKADLIIASYWLVTYRLKFVDASVPYISEKISFMIPPGAEFSSFEKFARPLDAVTWICLLIFIGCGFAAILLVKNFSSKKVQQFIFGVGVENPSLNIVNAIYGGSQKTLPKLNFARYLLMMFIIFCLVMRTLYVGSLFRFIQGKVHHKEVESIDDMIEKDYKVYLLESTRAVFSGAQGKLKNR